VPLVVQGVAWNDTEMLDFWGRCKFPDMRTMHGMTALHLAACHGDEAVVSALLRGGAKLDAAIADHHASIPWCSRGSTALHLAASFGHEAVCRTLISAQAFHPDLDLLRLRNRQVRVGLF
jgi:ankyrin repeat protein